MSEHDRQRRRLLEEIFAEAVELVPADREALLEARCADDTELADDVRSLLLAADGADTFFGQLSSRSGAMFAATPEAADVEVVESATRRFGPYRLERQIGVGGMGAVYYAERADDLFEKAVAIKLLPPGLGTEAMRRRFAAERRILARLHHPRIAGLLDGGVADDGTPFFVMEYVDGQPIDRFCEEEDLTVEARLRLFLQVCDAVEYAHRSLVVHRDLKPSNILVTRAGQAKLLDFGIAKVLDPEQTGDDAPLTGMHGRMLTPAFASPEQIRGEILTTAADVYALGVLLYLILTGRRPYDMGGLSTAEVERTICEVTPPLPSEAAATGSPKRGRRLRGDLDTMIMTALQKDPIRRYASVRALADDIERHLEGHPVLARPDTLGYRAGRFIARNRGLVGAAAMIVGLFGGFTSLAAYTAVTSRAQNRVIAMERDRAQLESEKAEAVADFLIGLFGASDPDVAAGATRTALELLEEGEASADALHAQPAVRSRVLDVIAQVYSRTGHYDRAESLFRRAIDIRRDLAAERPGEFDADLAGAVARLGNVLELTGRLDEAAAVLGEAIDLAVAADAPRIQANALNDLGLVHYAAGRYAHAEQVHRAALAIRQEVFGEQHDRVASSLHNLALALSSMNRADEAETLYRRALDMYREQLGPEHTSVATTLNTLGRLLMEEGRPAEAEPLLVEALRINRERLGPTHPRVALALNDIGAALVRQGDFEGAEQVFREALAIRETALGPDHQHVGISVNNLSHVLIQQGKLTEAEPFQRRAYEMTRDRFGADHIHTAIFAYNLGHNLDRLGRDGQAERLYREAIAIVDRLSPDHLVSARAQLALGELLLNQRRASEAEPVLRSALAVHRAIDADDDQITQVEGLLDTALTALGRPAEAVPVGDR